MSIASPIPKAIREAPPGDLQLTEVSRNAQAHIGKSIRWGGTIVALSNEEGGWTRIEIAEHPLDYQGQPENESPSEGRFLVRSTISFDPTIYAEGREITVAGVIERAGELPLVEAKDYYMWGQIEKVAKAEKEPARYRHPQRYRDRYPLLFPYGYYPPYRYYRYDPWYRYGYYYPYFPYYYGNYPSYRFGFGFGFGDQPFQGASKWFIFND